MEKGSESFARIRESIEDILFPRCCPVCERPLKKGIGLICPECEKLISYVEEPVCIKCGKELPVTSGEESLCEDCRRKSRSFDWGAALINYDGIMVRSMSAVKNRHKKEYLDFYAKRMSERLSEKLRIMRPDALIPVPVHRDRKRIRGYDHAEELALRLSELTGIPARTDILIRRKKTEALKKLGASERQRSLEGAFEVIGKTKGIHRACIVDDIYTTGATVEACTRALQGAGIEKVFFLCICIGAGREKG